MSIFWTWFRDLSTSSVTTINSYFSKPANNALKVLVKVMRSTPGRESFAFEPLCRPQHHFMETSKLLNCMVAHKWDYILLQKGGNVLVVFYFFIALGLTMNITSCVRWLIGCKVLVISPSCLNDGINWTVQRQWNGLTEERAMSWFFLPSVVEIHSKKLTYY